MSQEVIEKAFPSNGKARLKISNICGQIDIQPADGDMLTVKATKHLEHGDVERTEIEISQAEDGLVKVKTHFREGFLNFISLSHPCEVDYLVHIPRNCEVDASGVSCSVNVKGLEGEVKFSTVSGEMEMNDLAGNLTVSTVSGTIKGAQLAGSLHLHSVSGDARFTQSDLSAIKASTVSGDISLETPVHGEGFHFSSVSGNISISVPAGTACTVDLSSISGEIQADLPTTRQAASAGHRRVDVNGGGTLLSCSSVSGDVRLLNTAGEQADPTPEKKDLSEADRRTILERIAQGEMSAEEGLRALRD
jgi:hypothetical protein